MIPKNQNNDKWTDEQWSAIWETGSNILVSAGAGSGKTTVLTERLTQKILSGVSLRNLIVLTFTNDAAATMRERLYKSLTKQYEKTNNPYLLEQISLIDVSHVQTFDSFSMDIVKTYHYLLDLPSSINVLDSEIENLNVDKCLDQIVLDLFDQNDENVILLAKTYTTKNFDAVKNTIKYIYKKIGLIVEYNDNYFLDKFNHVDEYLNEYISSIKKDIKMCFDEIDHWKVDYDDDKLLNYIEKFDNKYSGYRTFIDHDLTLGITDIETPDTFKLVGDDKDQKESLKLRRDEVKKTFDSIKERVKYSKDELKDNYYKTYPLVKAIVYITNLLLEKINEFKKANNLYTFNDIAKMAYTIIKNNEQILNSYKNNINEILVDEYQDTSDIQEALINLISNGHNVYMVGDVKQSIYGFRNANPELFTEKFENYKNNNGGKLITLMKNFRSREEVINNINHIFENLMDKDYGGVCYNDDQKLIYGNKVFDTIDPLGNSNYNVEVLNYDLEKLSDKGFKTIQDEAFIIGYDILKKKNSMRILDGSYRPIRYSDFAVILKVKKHFKEFRKVFDYLGIPLIIKDRAPFIHSEEIVFVKSCLEAAYSKMNPTDTKYSYKLAVLSILRSFVVEASDDIIHKIFYNNDIINIYDDFPQIDQNITKYGFMLHKNSLSEIIDEIYHDFDIYHQIIKLGNVLEKEKKLQFLYQKSMEFNNFDIVDFLEYLDFIYNDPDKDIEYNAENEDVDAVTITTIHKSKGLEYPICYFGMLEDRKKTGGEPKTKYSPKYGIIAPYMENGVLHRTFLNDLNKKSEQCDWISEQIRLFYVALTRAKEKFILVTPEIPKKPVKSSIKNHNEMLAYSKEYLDYYSVFIDLLSNPTFTKNYYISKNKSLPIANNTIVYQDIKQESKKDEFVRPSKKTLSLIEQNIQNNMDFGTKMHNILENVSVIDSKIVDYKDKNVYNIVSNFLNSDFIKSLNIIHEYHEYGYFDEEGHKSIIDLILETEDKLYIIDYKLKNIDSPEYIDQLHAYRDYLKTVSCKDIEMYLYSMTLNKFKKLD